MQENTLNIFENRLCHVNSEIIKILLKDRTTNKNIIWACNDYQVYGNRFLFASQIKEQDIVGKNRIIKPRILKSLEQKKARSKEKAEVFTPSWICNAQNNLIDEQWFNKKEVFNKEFEDKTWKTNSRKISFTSSKKTWTDYVKDIRLEITCGEAPYLVSIYDTVSGNFLEIKNRIGLLDRKLRVINENASSKKEWEEQAIIAYKSIYGFEYQGDNLIIARENLFLTFIEYYSNKFDKEPSIDLQKEIATIISWNIFQMDGLKCVIPNSCVAEKQIQMTLDFGFEDDVTKENESNICRGCLKKNVKQHTGIYSKIKNWETNKIEKFVDSLN